MNKKEEAKKRQEVDTSQVPVSQLQQSNIIQELAQQLVTEANSTLHEAVALVPKLTQLQKHVREFTAQSYDVRFDLNAKTELVDSLSKNCSFLEEKLASLMTEKEETIVDLKSQLIIFKQKAKGYKTKLQVELESFKKNALLHEKHTSQKQAEKYELELSEASNKLQVETQKSKEL